MALSKANNMGSHNSHHSNVIEETTEAISATECVDMVFRVDLVDFCDFVEDGVLNSYVCVLETTAYGTGNCPQLAVPIFGTSSLIFCELRALLRRKCDGVW